MKHNQKGFGHRGLLAVIVILAVIAGTGWLVFKSKHGSRTTSIDRQHSSGGITVTTNQTPQTTALCRVVKIKYLLIFQNAPLMSGDSM